MFSACSTEYMQVQFGIDAQEYDYQQPIVEAFYTVEGEYLRVYVRAFDDGSRFIIDDESGTLLLISIPIDRLDSNDVDDSMYAFFRILGETPLFAGYMKLDEYRIERDNDAITLSASCTSTFVFSHRENESYRASVDGLVVNQRDAGELSLDAFDNGDFAEAYAEKFGKPWEGPKMMPPDQQ